MANSPSHDTGMIQVLLERLNNQRLPRAIELKSKVDRGERLDNLDMQFLKTVFEDASVAQNLAAKHPEFQPLVAKLVGLYSAITSKGLENEPKDVTKPAP